MGVHPVLAAGETFCYSYKIDIPSANIHAGGTYKVTANVTITNHSGHLGELFGPSPSATANLPATPNLLNDSITVTDTNGKSFLFNQSGSAQYTETFTCNQDEGTHVNIASAQIIGPDGQLVTIFDTASVTVKCYELEVTKDSSTSLTRIYNWTINKAADQFALTLAPNEQFLINYSVEVNPVSSTDSNFAVSGNIVVHNPAPFGAVINSISDLITGIGSVTVNCTVSFPYTLPAGGNLNCTYTASLPDEATRTNTAAATLQNFIYDFAGTSVASGTTDFLGSASVSFAAAAVTEVDKCVTVIDDFAGTLGTICNMTKTFLYSRSIGPFSSCGDYAVTNTASFITNDTGSTGSSSWTVNVHVPCAGCTLTIGYWKTHAGFGPQSDMVTPLLPVYLGTPGGSKTILVSNNVIAVNILNQNVYGEPSNGITKLYAQLLGAKLNAANGADDSAVSSIISAADAFLVTHNFTNWVGLSKSEKQKVLGWVTILDNYNNGLIGPGHCSQ
ncbi:MAG: hypothetical protein ACM3KR_05590 [Deltaproteobacteria bacterium]